eukprot:g4055.t1
MTPERKKQRHPTLICVMVSKRGFGLDRCRDAVCLETPAAAVHGGPAEARIVAEEAGFGNENDDALVVPIVITVDAKAAPRLQSRTRQGRVHNDDDFFPSPQHACKNVTVGRFRYSRAHTPIVTEFFPKKIVGDDTLQIHGHRLGNALAFLSEQAVGNPIPKWRGACKEIHHFDQAGFLPRRRQLALECRAPAATSGRALLEVVDAKFGRACFAGPLEGNKKPPLLQVESAGLSESPLQESGAFLQYDLRLSYARKLDERVDRLASATQRLGLLVEEHGREDGTAAPPAHKSVVRVGRRMSMKTREKNALPSQFAESTDSQAKGSFGGGNFLRLVGQGFAPDDVIYVCGQPCSGSTQNAIFAATTASLFSGAGAGSSPSGASEFSAGAASSRTRLAAAAGSGSSSGSSSAHHKPIRTTRDSTAQNTGEVAPANHAAPLLFPESVLNLLEIQAERGELHQGVASFQSRVCETPAYVPPPPMPAQLVKMFSAYSFSGAGSLFSRGNIMQPIRGSGSSSIGGSGSGSASGSAAAAGSGVGSASVVSMASTGGFPETPFPASKTCDVRILSRATGILTELRDAFRYDATLTPMLTSVERKSADVILISAGRKLSGDLTRVFWNDLECENVAVDAADGDDDVDEERESARQAKEVAKDAAQPPKTVPGSAHAVKRRLKKAARKLFRNHPLIRKIRAAFRRKRLKARFVDTLEELVSDIAGVPHKRMRRRFRRRIRKLRAPTSGSSTAPSQRTPLPVKKRPTAEQESALKYVVRRKVQKDPAQGVRLVVSCPGMFATAGKVRVYEPMVGFAFEGAPGMTEFPALNQDTDGGKRARPDFLPKEPVVKRANFNPVESYAGRKCAAAEHDCPPGWQCCPMDDGGSHCSPTCLA